MIKQPQELFDEIVTHLYRQGERAFDAELNICKYRLPMPDGRVLKCAIGGIIPDSEYRPSFEGKSLSILPLDLRTKVLGLTNVRLDDVAVQLQKVHDLYEVADWLSALQSVAERFQLRTETLLRVSQEWKDRS